MSESDEKQLKEVIDKLTLTVVELVERLKVLERIVAEHGRQLVKSGLPIAGGAYADTVPENIKS